MEKPSYSGGYSRSYKPKSAVYIKVFALMLIFVGLGLLAFPAISARRYVQAANSQINKFNNSSAKISSDEKAQIYSQMQAYNTAIFLEKQAKLKDPFADEQQAFKLANFGLEENIVAYIEIETLNIKLPIYLGASPQNLEQGAALLAQTSLPIGGENTNAVIAAHRGHPKAELFKNINKIKVGDIISIVNFKETLQYSVFETKIIKPDNINAVLIKPKEDLITLLACHPYGSDKQRYIVFCKKIS